MKNLTKHSRVGKYGSILMCPECDYPITVYHLAWDGIQCTKCHIMHQKLTWLFVAHRTNGPTAIQINYGFQTEFDIHIETQTDPAKCACPQCKPATLH